MSKNFPEYPEYLSCYQVAEILGVSRDTVVNRFGDMPEVLDLSSDKTAHRERRYRVLRIPRGLLNRYLEQRRVGRCRSLPEHVARKKRQPRPVDSAGPAPRVRNASQSS